MMGIEGPDAAAEYSGWYVSRCRAIHDASSRNAHVY